MVTLRVHLDPQTRANGALEVLPGSHRCSLESADEGEVVEADAGSVLMLRPLLLHRSSSGFNPSGRRRVVHLEYAGTERPAAGYGWAPVW
jgi:ectoine hydroxylase-related dioxygenase (phytanoyl-CoA dioxygenase family)